MMDCPVELTDIAKVRESERGLQMMWTAITSRPEEERKIGMMESSVELSLADFHSNNEFGQRRGSEVE